MKEKGISNFIRQRKKQLRLGIQECRETEVHTITGMCVQIYTKTWTTKLKAEHDKGKSTHREEKPVYPSKKKKTQIGKPTSREKERSI